MMIARVRVVALKEGYAWVEKIADSGCSRCGVWLYSQFRKPRYRIRPASGQLINCGDELTIGQGEHGLMRALFYLYALPLIALVLGAALGALFATWLSMQDFADFFGATGAFGGFGLAFFVSKGSRFSGDAISEPVILAINSNTSQP